MTTLIELKGIKLEKKGKEILDVKHLEINEGSVIGLVGPNGAGKSTLLKVMSFLEQPDQGVIIYRGENVTKQIGINFRREIAVVFQQPLMLNTTVFKNVAISLKLRKLKKEEINVRVSYWLKQFGIEHLKNQNAKTLSGGEAQRVALARSMVSEPKLLFLDEPFSALDLPTKRKLLVDFKRILSQTKTTTIFVSHDYQEIKYLCEEMLILYNGRLITRSSMDVDYRLFSGHLSDFLKDWITPLAT